MPDSLVLGRSNTRKAAKLAVYDATMIIANPAQTMPRTRAEKLLGVPARIAEMSGQSQNHGSRCDGLMVTIESNTKGSENGSVMNALGQLWSIMMGRFWALLLMAGKVASHPQACCRCHENIGYRCLSVIPIQEYGIRVEI